ncbi:chromosome segregation protein SMC [Halobaculum sp. WSA2]|uniref:Chromosome segregation protein SMC n=1 Tax=Halobaculum saliterrae TaxID=2073113 RepID=A0A6B0SZX1_9EURY|nr:chromosome segregation protein SMC [Halobaculum saliterrae]MXR41520.1 chromosome segregation protein SMC [Halobaculum saliterrae]
MGNRVEDLETQVAELQAAVDGLTEELVEAKERISQLEQATEVEEESTPDRNPNAEFVPNESATNGAADDEGTMADDEGAAQKAARGADGETPEESDSSDDDSDDIIVA